MSTGVEDVEGCLDFCEDFEFFGVLDALDKALMCFCYNSEAEYQLYGESDICIDGLGGEDDGMCAMDVYEITCAMDKHVGCWTADEDGAEASTVWMSEGVEDIDGCHDFCADDFEFFGVLDVLDKALMCLCFSSETEYQQYGASDICVDGLGGEDDGICAMDVYDITTCSSPSPTLLPSSIPTLSPSSIPTLPPSSIPTLSPSSIPTPSPTDAPIIPGSPTRAPTAPTTAEPTTFEPTLNPTPAPTTAEPTTSEPTTAKPTDAPIIPGSPTRAPTDSAAPTTAKPTTAEPTTSAPTSAAPTTATPTTRSPTAAPTPKCMLGATYAFEGVPCQISGESHTTMWNGGHHDFQGHPDKVFDVTENDGTTLKNQFYYVAPCADMSAMDLPE